MSQGQLDNQENYRTEYKEVAATYRFHVSLRFIVAAFTATIQSALLNIYNQALQQSRPLGHTIIIPFVGITTMIAVFAIEWRNISVFRIMMRRGKELEFNLGLIDGQFSRLSDPELVKPKGSRRFLTHTWGIGLIYVMIWILWIVLSIFSFTNH